MSTTAPLLLIAGLLAQASAPPPVEQNRTTEGPDAAVARLASMKKAAASYNIHPVDDRATTYRLQPEPSFRFVNPVGTVTDGAIFFWLGEGDRPEAAIQVFLMSTAVWRRWTQELTSFSTRALIGEAHTGPDWTPSGAGVAFKPVPGAPRPAETAMQRLRQMHALARDFAVDDLHKGETWYKLRLLARPLARYGKPGTGLLDGGLFCFALGTDPEAFLFLEARPGEDGPEWQFAFAPMSVYALRGMWKRQEVWSLPWRKGDNGPNKLYHVRIGLPGESDS